MHELSICSSIASLVEQHAGDRRVQVVHLDVGHLRQVVPETLRHSWGFVVEGTSLAGSVLEVRDVPARINCRECGESTTIDVPVFRCPCGSTLVDVVSGDELLLTSLDLLAADVPPSDQIPADAVGDDRRTS